MVSHWIAAAAVNWSEPTKDDSDHLRAHELHETGKRSHDEAGRSAGEQDGHPPGRGRDTSHAGARTDSPRMDDAAPGFARES